MSDIMLFAVLEMPYDMAMSNELSRIQFYERVQQAVERIHQQEEELAAKQARIDALENSVSIDDFIREIEQCPGMKDKLADARKWLADQAKPSFASDTLDDGWIRWYGKGYPELTSNVEIRLRNPDENTNYRFNWIHDGSSGDVIAYRVVG